MIRAGSPSFGGGAPVAAAGSPPIVGSAPMGAGGADAPSGRLDSDAAPALQNRIRSQELDFEQKSFVVQVLASRVVYDLRKQNRGNRKQKRDSSV